ncbi:DNA recombination protein RmuC [Holophaga foetida]|uniref:DNA recombination protein RmuC n=1 Tax=Holophaga foetida TaxID=35839 RepID=UPI0002EFC291|nr:DNA recombination protein RmuC [Holophaga foetida]
MDTSQLFSIGLAFLAGAGAMALLAKARRPLSVQDIEDAHQRLRQEFHDSQGRVVQAFAQGTESQGRQVQDALAMGRSEQGRHLEAMQLRLERGLELLRGTTEERLERMRQSMDERLRTSLDQRLGESFRQVSERLESVHRGLGEMASLAQDVGGLKRVLSNVKSRGVLGEVQLGAVLEQFLAPGQFETQKRLVAGSREAVDFAVRLPGPEGEPVWIPIDAKFPLEDYQRLQEARDRGDQDGANRAGAELERRVLLEAVKINGKYILPPHTTDFALLFVPTEGLYAEILGRPGLFDRIHRKQRVVVVGPTNLCAFLSSLQAGFASHAISQRSGEVWKVLGEVKAEFQRFGVWIQGVQSKLQAATREMDKVGVRTRQMERKLQGVAEMPVSSELSFEAEPGAEGPFLASFEALEESESVD